MPDPVWLDRLRELICRIYQEWGGDCANLPFEVPARIQAVVAMHEQHGAPQVQGVGALQAFLDVLTETEDLLNSQANSLAPADDAALRKLISDLRDELTP